MKVTIKNESQQEVAERLFGASNADGSLDAVVDWEKQTIVVGTMSTKFEYAVAPIVNPETGKPLKHFSMHTYTCGAYVVESTNELNGHHLVSYLVRKILAEAMGKVRKEKPVLSEKEKAELEAERAILKALKAKK